MKLKRLSKEPWFGKNADVYGKRPITWQGWFVTTMFLVILAGLLLMMFLNYQYVWNFIEVIGLLILIFLITASLTSDRKTKI